AERRRAKNLYSGELHRRSIEVDGYPHDVKSAVSSGERVPDDVIEELLLPELFGRFVLEGYPRSSTQAQRLDRLLDERDRPLDGAVELELDDETLVVRMVLRADAEHRTDDRPAGVIRRLGDSRRDI